MRSLQRPMSPQRVVALRTSLLGNRPPGLPEDKGPLPGAPTRPCSRPARHSAELSMQKDLFHYFELTQLKVTNSCEVSLLTIEKQK